METWSRKRAGASSSANPTAARTFKHPRYSTTSSSSTPVASCTRHASSAVMDFEHEFGRCRSSDRKSERDRDLPSGKGKEREMPENSSRTREMEREAERILGLSFDSVGADNDNDNEGGASILPQKFMSASSALQGLLRKLGARLDDLLSPPFWVPPPTKADD